MVIVAVREQKSYTTPSLDTQYEGFILRKLDKKSPNDQSSWSAGAQGQKLYKFVSNASQVCGQAFVGISAQAVV